MGVFPQGIKWVEQEVDHYIVLRLKIITGMKSESSSILGCNTVTVIVVPLASS